jgi:hypothetical protein
MRVAGLDVGFNASGAADAGARGRVVVIVDVVDTSTSAEVAVAGGAAVVLGASAAGVDPPAHLDPGAVGRRAAAIAKERNTDVLVVSEPRVGTDDERRRRAVSVLQALRTASVDYELVPNQGAELAHLVDMRGRPVVIVSTTGGTAFDAAMAAGAPAGTFATTARIEGRTGWDVIGIGARRAIALAGEHRADLSVVAATANSSDDCLAAFEIARRIITEGFLRR